MLLAIKYLPSRNAQDLLLLLKPSSCVAFLTASPFLLTVDLHSGQEWVLEYFVRPKHTRGPHLRDRGTKNPEAAVFGQPGD